MSRGARGLQIWSQAWLIETPGLAPLALAPGSPGSSVWLPWFKRLALVVLFPCTDLSVSEYFGILRNTPPQLYDTCTQNKQTRFPLGFRPGCVHVGFLCAPGPKNMFTLFSISHKEIQKCPGRCLQRRPGHFWISS